MALYHLEVENIPIYARVGRILLILFFIIRKENGVMERLGILILIPQEESKKITDLLNKEKIEYKIKEIFI